MPSDVVSASAVVDAPAAVVFGIVANPYAHARIDGSGSVRRATSGPERLRLGDRFDMDMRIGAPYKMRNEVVEYDENKLIAWRTRGVHRWRYELEERADGTTEVTESWDASRWSTPVRLAFRLIGYLGRNRRGIERTLVKLKAAAELDAQTA